MEPKVLKELMVFDELEADCDLSQRKLASKLDVSLGLVNSILKRFVRKGYMKVSSVPGSRMKYLLTSKGASEKTRLTYLYIKYSINKYEEIYSYFCKVFERLFVDNQRHIVFYGVSEIAEVAFYVAQDTGIEVVAVFDNERQGDYFMGMVVLGPSEIIGLKYDRIIITDQQSSCDDMIGLGIPSDMVITF